ncbi:MAG: DUF2852 domain-containing protein [Roseiarcus sp.]|jgi:hypothetical protein
MSTAQSSFGGSNGAREFGPGEWANTTWRRRGCGASRWTAFELVAMILGFIVFWPIGLAILAYKFWQRKTGGEDLQTFATGKWNEARSAMAGASRSYSCGPWGRGGSAGAPTGNSAFDEWRAGELARLEAERRKLEEAQREFSEFVENVRKAKDREEFEGFMNARNRPQA